MKTLMAPHVEGAIAALEKDGKPARKFFDEYTEVTRLARSVAQARTTICNGCSFGSPRALVALMTVTVADVFLRYLFNRPVRGSYDLVESMLLVFVFNGMAAAFFGRRNIVIDLLDSFVGERATGGADPHRRPAVGPVPGIARLGDAAAGLPGLRATATSSSSCGFRSTSSGSSRS